MKSKVNLHIHTTHSDGGKTVAEVIEGLRNNGVEYFSITDHDSVDGNGEAADLAIKYGMVHIQGIELSCCFDGEAGLDESYVFHLVGLGFDLSKMQQELQTVLSNKENKLIGLAKELVANGYKIDIDNLFRDGQVNARKNIAQELISKGYAKNMDEAFASILNSDKFRPFAKNVPTIQEGIKIIHDCGGLAIWAHPFGVMRGGKKSLTKEQVLELGERLVEYGIDGVECYYHKYEAEQIRFLTTIARKNKLIKSIGTDYHHLPFDEKKHPELMPLREKESLVFDVDGISADENIILHLMTSQEILAQLVYSAKLGVESSQVSLGTMYYNGQGLQQDYAEARKWLELAAESGSPDAMYILGNLYHMGLGIEKDEIKAFKLFLKAAESNRESANKAATWYNLALCYRDGKGTVADAQKHFKWLQKAADTGLVVALFNMGYAYAHGIGTERNIENAVKWYEDAAQKGNIKSECNLGFLYLEEQDFEKAINWLEKASKSGDVKSQNALRSLYSLTGSDDEKRAKPVFLEFVETGMLVSRLSSMETAIKEKKEDAYVVVIQLHDDKVISVWRRRPKIHYSEWDYIETHEKFLDYVDYCYGVCQAHNVAKILKALKDSNESLVERVSNNPHTSTTAYFSNIKTKRWAGLLMGKREILFVADNDIIANYQSEIEKLGLRTGEYSWNRGGILIPTSKGSKYIDDNGLLTLDMKFFGDFAKFCLSDGTPPFGEL